MNESEREREREQLDLTMVVLKGPKKKIPHWVLKGRDGNSKACGVHVKSWTSSVELGAKNKHWHTPLDLSSCMGLKPQSQAS